ncbi:Exonuclease SbcC [Microbacterium sp. Nx66]|nr:Exonuclease SbcC [Microbacterium sp. Nx66]
MLRPHRGTPQARGVHPAPRVNRRALPGKPRPRGAPYRFRPPGSVPGSAPGPRAGSKPPLPGASGVPS